MKTKLCFLLFLICIQFQAQEKHQFYTYWGWNRAIFTNSDITFTSPDYNFTLENVSAHDRPTDFAINPYLNPGKMTVPQYNFRIGYYINSKISISIGVDHMKYVVDDNQIATIRGKIALNNNKYNGNYNGETIELAEDFLRFEHTDGLNYINSDIRRHFELFFIHSKKRKIITFGAQIGLGAGIYYPRTSSILLNKRHKDEFKICGFGYNGIIGPKITFFNIAFIASEFKMGQTLLSNIETSYDNNDFAKQNFWYFQYNLVFGVEYKLFNKKKKNEPQSLL